MKRIHSSLTHLYGMTLKWAERLYLIVHAPSVFVSDYWKSQFRYRHEIRFDVCVTVYHRYSDINSQLDARITNFIDNYNKLNMFRAIISPILRSNRLFTACGIMHRRSCLLVHYTTSCKYSLEVACWWQGRGGTSSTSYLSPAGSTAGGLYHKL